MPVSEPQKTQKISQALGQKRLPNLVIAGVVKGGTTSLWTYLAKHPAICSSSVKETCYFSVYRYGRWDSRYRDVADPPIDPFSQFQSYFCHCQQQPYVMEATPGYFAGGEAVAKEIKKTLGDDTRVIIVLRDPVDRFISFWKYKKSMLELPPDLPLADYVRLCQQATPEILADAENARYEGLEAGYYADHLEDWHRVFGLSLKVVFFDDLKQDSGALLSDISRWLGIDDTFFATVDLSVQNKSIGYKNARLQKAAIAINDKAEKFWRSHPAIKNRLRTLYYALNGGSHTTPVDDATRQQLEQIYAPYNQRLAMQLCSWGYGQLPGWLGERSQQLTISQDSFSTYLPSGNKP